MLANEVYKNDLLAIYNTMWNRAASNPCAIEWYASEIQKATEKYIKSASVLPGTFRNSGGNVAGIGRIQ